MAVSSDDIENALAWRYATKKFDPLKKISEQDWKTLEKSLHLAPSSFGLQPWKFIVIKDPALRQKLRPHSWNQPQIVDASHMVVMTIRKNLSKKQVERHLANISNVRGTPAAALEDYKTRIFNFLDQPESAFDVNAWATRQVYIALGMFLETAALLGIDACPMEGLDPSEYDKILNLKDSGYHTVVVVTAGYRAKDDVFATYKKVRFPITEIIEEL